MTATQIPVPKEDSMITTRADWTNEPLADQSDDTLAFLAATYQKYWQIADNLDRYYDVLDEQARRGGAK